jgi:uncharacterized protein (TIGR02118 family)
MSKKVSTQLFTHSVFHSFPFAMIRLTVLYPKTDSSQFDLTYYLEKHIPLVKERLTPFGLTGVDMQEGLAAENQPLYAMITGLAFNTTDELEKGMGTHGAELLGDIPNFTDVQPVTQVCRVL